MTLLSNKNLIEVLKIFCFVCLVAIPYQYYQDYQTRMVEINFYRDFVLPPLDCGPKGRTIQQLGWIEWAGHSIWKDKAKQECMNYIKKLTQSPWPNLLHSVSNTFVQLGQIPILVFISGFSTGLELYTKSLLITILVPVALVVLVYLLWSESWKKNNGSFKEFKQAMIEDLKGIYQECVLDKKPKQIEEPISEREEQTVRQIAYMLKMAENGGYAKQTDNKMLLKGCFD